MKAVILAGGLGTRLSEETSVRPKPMVEIGGKPILWHILKIYSHYGINDFIICLGYKGYFIKEYFANYALHNSDVTFDMTTGNLTVHDQRTEPWTVTLVDTGDHSMTGGRLKRVQKYLSADEPFCLTYGDGVADIDINQLLEFHRKHGKAATLTATYPPGRFGALHLEGDQITHFQEKPMGDGAVINGGFFVLDNRIFAYLKDDKTIWEQEPLQGLAKDGQLMAYTHKGFWQPMDTLRDKDLLNHLWESNKAPWKVWS